jgi:NADH:ubiquinone oxidoreductase subunit 5 (subunit L)/multisubunit Na+/H+ antiporter MnhA subunit
VRIRRGHLLFDVNLIHLEAELVEKTTLFFFMVVLIARRIFIWRLSYMRTFYKMTVFFVSLIRFVVSMLLLILRKRLFIVFLG